MSPLKDERTNFVTSILHLGNMHVDVNCATSASVKIDKLLLLLRVGVGGAKSYHQGDLLLLLRFHRPQPIFGCCCCCCCSVGVCLLFIGSSALLEHVSCPLGRGQCPPNTSPMTWPMLPVYLDLDGDSLQVGRKSNGCVVRVALKYKQICAQAENTWLGRKI